MNFKRMFVWLLLIIVLLIIYIPIWILGSVAVADLIPDTPSEHGLVNEGIGILLLSIINTLLIVGLIVSSRLNGLQLSLVLALAYYGSFTLLPQLETWYFLGELTVSPELLRGLFLMGLPIPLLFIPLAVVICARWKPRGKSNANTNVVMSNGQLVLKLGIIAVTYLVIYWIAGYYIAWQNPELRAFYGSPGEIVPFWEHTFSTLKADPGLFILQLVRGVLFAFIVIPLIRGSKVKSWITAVLVGLLLAVPHLGHILSNPLMPIASVRLSHMIETVTSTFLFGVFIVWILHRRHHGLKDLLDLKSLKNENLKTTQRRSRKI